MSCQLGINLNLSGKTLTWIEAVLRYLCEQSGKHYDNGVYFVRQTFFKTGRILTGKFDLDFEPSVSKTAVAQSLPSTPAQQTLRSMIEAFKSFKSLRDLHFKGQVHFKPKAPDYLKGSKLFKVAYPNSGGQKLRANSKQFADLADQWE